MIVPFAPDDDVVVGEHGAVRGEDDPAALGDTLGRHDPDVDGARRGGRRGAGDGAVRGGCGAGGGGDRRRGRGAGLVRAWSSSRAYAPPKPAPPPTSPAISAAATTPAIPRPRRGRSAGTIAGGSVAVGYGPAGRSAVAVPPQEAPAAPYPGYAVAGAADPWTAGPGSTGRGSPSSAVHAPLVVPAAVALLVVHRTPSLRSVGPAAIVTARRRCDIDSLASSLMNPGCVARLGGTCDTAGSSASVHRGRAVKCCEVPPSRPDDERSPPVTLVPTRGSSSQRCGRHTGVKPGRTARSRPGERDLRSGSPARTGSEHSGPAYTGDETGPTAAPGGRSSGPGLLPRSRRTPTWTAS